MYSKEMQLKHNKKPKDNLKFGLRRSRGSFGKKSYKWNNKGRQRITTDKELSYIQWSKSQEMSCFVCGRFADDRHHVKFKSTDKKNHKRLLPLCREHHTGSELSPHGTPRLWREFFPMAVQNDFADKLYAKWISRNSHENLEN